MPSCGPPNKLYVNCNNSFSHYISYGIKAAMIINSLLMCSHPVRSMVEPMYNIDVPFVKNFWQERKNELYFYQNTNAKKILRATYRNHKSLYNLVTKLPFPIDTLSHIQTIQATPH